MGLARPSFERIQLGLVLRRLRETAGKTQQDAADRLGKVRSRVIALEDGKSTTTEAELIVLLDCYGVLGAERETALELGVVARQRAKRRARVDLLSDSYRRFADLEASASEISSFETGVIPGLLQCQEYTRALLAEGDDVRWPAGGAEFEDRLAFRLARPAAVFDDPLPRTMRFVIAEEAFRANLGDPAVMRAQRRYLVKLIDQRRDLIVRVLPSGVYGNPLRGSNLLVFRFDERGTSVGYSESAFGPSAYHDDPGRVAVMLKAFQRVWELALSRRDSRQFVERVAREL